MPLRYPVSTAIVAVALALMAGVFLFARPVYHAASGGETITLPKRFPAADHAGATGWQWLHGLPGWQPGEMLGKRHDFNVSGVQPVELVPAQIAAARTMLDASRVRVLATLRPGARGAIGVLAAPELDTSPAQTCLAALLPANAPVRWQCPNQPRDALAKSPVLVVAERDRWPNGLSPLWAVGVARGDVARIVQVTPTGRAELYRRGNSWGEFTDGNAGNGPSTLEVYGDHGRLLERIGLNLKPGTTRVVG
jgi:hypothetical protein